MKKLLLAFAFCSALSAATTVSNIRFDGIGDSSVRVIWDYSGTTPTNLRIRYNTSETSGGSGGYLQISGSSPGYYTPYDMTQLISGLAPSTTYYVSPEMSSDGGSTWSSGVSATVTTTARGTTTPTAPTAVSTTYPTQTGSTYTITDCDDGATGWNARMAAISAGTIAYGSTISVAAGTHCDAENYVLPDAPGMQSFTSSAVRTSDSTLNITGHGFTENQEVRLSAGAPNSSCLPGMAFFIAGLNCDYGGDGVRKGEKYWVHVVDANRIQILSSSGGSAKTFGWIPFTCNAGADTISIRPGWFAPNGYAHYTYSSGIEIPVNTIMQFKSTGTLCGGLSVDTDYYVKTNCPNTGAALCTFQLSLTSGGSVVDITSAGSGTHTIVDKGAGTMYIAPAPGSTWIVIQTDGTIPAFGTRTGPSYDAQNFRIRRVTPLQSSNYVLKTGVMTRNIRLVGLTLDTASNTDYTTTIDPRGYGGIMQTTQDAENVVFDRCRVQGPGYPNRFGASTAIQLNGRGIVLKDCYMAGMDYWHVNQVGLTVSRVSSTVARLSAFSTYTGASYFGTKTTTGNTDFTITGGNTTGTGYIYYTLAGVLTLLPPGNITATCSTAGVTCAVLSAVASPDWPLSAGSRRAAVRVATISFTAGAVTSVDAQDYFSSQENTEGSQAILGGQGPGPYLITNNFISGTGNTMHFDDSGGPYQLRGDYTVSNNTFDVPETQRPFSATTDTLRYGHRQALEWKGGARILLDGNTFQGNYPDISNNAVAVAFTPRSGGDVLDVDIVNNTFKGGGGIDIPRPIDSYLPISKPTQRMRVSNNLFLLNGAVYTNYAGSTARGWALLAGYGGENLLVEHNTVFDNRGSYPSFIYLFQHSFSGVKIQNNIFFYGGEGPPFRGENVSPTCGSADTNVTLMNCAFTEGPANPVFTFSKNVIVPSWSSTTAGTGIVALATVQGAFSGYTSTNYIPTGGTVAANLALIKFMASDTTGTYTSLDLRLASDSPYKGAGTDGLDIGYIPASTSSSVTGSQFTDTKALFGGSYKRN